ncbi:efflux RND transporter periplasmic adaptor subunit [Hoeflea sp. TYP-13]|uniref:efflux RND transporter periplasmic adaptor subunit n=1 Tax=Hoeflea sp. TYP-13 TaxID=3230023 RepID=UPI0034C67CF6
MTRWFTAGLVIFCMAFAAFAQSADQIPPSVVVAEVKSEVAQAAGSYVGRVAADSTVDLVARVEGFLEKRNFVEGGLVNKGDVLYQIEKAPYEASLSKAEAELKGAEATAKNAELYLERQKKLLETGDVPQSTVDQAVATLGADQAAVSEAKSDVETAKINLGYTDIVSPMDGRISQSAISVGNLVNSDSGTLATITSVDPINVNFYISEKDLLEERKQGLMGENSSKLTVKITLADGELYPAMGRVTYIDNEIQAATDTIELQATISNKDGILIAGQFVTVELDNPDAKPVLTVPQPALQLDKDGHFVFTVGSDNKVERRNVKLGKQLSGNWVVTSGLSEGEKVIVQGLQKVHEGVEVKPVPGQS